VSWTTVFLGIIAVASLVTAIVQVAVVVVAGRLARSLGRLADRLDREMTPLFEQFNAIARDAAKAASLTTSQVERVDRLFEDVAGRVEEAARTFQSIVTGPVREGAALIAGFKAVLSLIRDVRSRRVRRRADDEDALFI
jgi:hypothetical protein